MVSSFSAKPLYEYIIDYSAANEYVEAHYSARSTTSTRRSVYFGAHEQREPIFDARNGVHDSISGNWNTASFENCGFCLVKSSFSTNRVHNWHDLEDINAVYLTELRTTIQNVYQGSTILDIIFWNPMIREESFSQTRSRNTSVTPTASYAACPHIDVDVGAHIDSEHLIDLIENNSLDQHGYSFRRDSLIKAINEGKRFAIVNAWCNTASEPVRRAPLALFSVRYEEDGTAFPQGEPNLERSQWYTFSEVRPDEILFFCQYDRDVRRPSDIWHCSLTGIGNQVLHPPRRSFDIRCLIVFDEIVPEKSDRFHFNRTKALMNKEESAVFCSKQSLRRSHGGTSDP